jgi:outer membrane protein assembly factor BamC
MWRKTPAHNTSNSFCTQSRPLLGETRKAPKVKRLSAPRLSVPVFPAPLLPTFAPGLVLLAVALTLSGCGMLESVVGGDKVDYRSSNTKAQPLEVPPDLTQLARDSRYQAQGGVVSAAAAAGPATGAAGAAAAGLVAPKVLGTVRLERQGQQRWLVTEQTPEQLWPLLKGFFEQRGFTLALDNPQAGLLETNWAENRAKLPNDLIRTSIGRVFGGLFDTGERDLYRVRVERSATAGGGTEIYLTHRGAEEIYSSDRKDSTQWRARPNDPQLEAEMLARLMVALGNKEVPVVASAASVSASAAAAGGADTAAKATVAADSAVPTATSLSVNESFDRAWRRVGLALDRGGFTVEDRDRAAGLYYVRYVDPKSVGKDEPNFFTKLFSDATNPQAAVRYRIVLKAEGDKTKLSVQDAKGMADVGDNAKRIVALLGNELR